MFYVDDEYADSKKSLPTTKYAVARSTARVIIFMGYATMACSIFSVATGDLMWIVVFGGGAIFAGIIQVAAGQMLTAVLDGVESLNTLASIAEKKQ